MPCLFYYSGRDPASSSSYAGEQAHRFERRTSEAEFPAKSAVRETRPERPDAVD